MATVELAPGQEWAPIVYGTPPGTTFRVLAGVHRLTTFVEARDGDAFAGDPGAVVSGARLLTEWHATGGRWYCAGQTQQGERIGVCRWDYPLCLPPEDLWFDYTRLRHVATREEVNASTWHFDYMNDRIYIGRDPAGHTVETSIAPSVITNHGITVNGVTIANLVIEKFASPGERAAISAPNSRGWRIEDCEVREAHSAGIGIGGDSTITRCRLYDNGQVGLGAWNVDRVTITDCEFRGNGGFFDPYWGAGGLKVAQIRHLTITGCTAIANKGPGLWADINCREVAIARNTAIDNEQAGIFYEISANAEIYDNVVRRNGFGVSEGPARAGIFISASRNVEVFGNTVEENASGIIAYDNARGFSTLYNEPYCTAHVHVHDNVITMIEGVTGVMAPIGDPAFASVRFDRNRYRLGPASHYFAWNGADTTVAGWQAAGQDTHGTFTPVTRRRRTLIDRVCPCLRRAS